ncbi:unnamed protein product [Echinostoma caproni]|uniref:EF-hand domain-containing protein n=1 Tax=Echinostoma caproni TaxID=27848 RepID=A0A183AG35_9TREM|nr:unnamed protein product [Echinostoma caproni]
MGLTAEQRQKLAEYVFRDIDENGDGKISVEEVLKAAPIVTPEYKHFVEEIFKKYDTDGDGLLDHDEFVNYLEKENVQ